MGIHFGVRNVKKSLHLVACIFRGDLLEFLLEYLKYSNDSETEGDFMFSVSEASVAVITGGSSGIGLNAARALRDRGLNVYELSRRAENAEPGVTHLQADVTDETQVNAAVAEILRREGRIDILINNAGFGISGAIEFTPPQEARRQFDVNFFGMVNMNRAVLPVMRQQGGGRIVNMSSVAAPIAIPFQAYYSASKAAVRTYSLALASEVRPFGIEVCVIMPGDIATGFTAARRKSCGGDDVYNGRIARSVAVMEHDERTGMSAQFAGQFVARRATQKHPKLICTMGRKYALFVFLMRILPTRTATRIVGRIYAS